MKITDTDKGYRALVKRVFGIGRPTIAVGVLSGQGAEDSHPGEGEEMLTNLEVAIFNEFGTEHIPARSFVRAWYDENEAQLREDLSVLMKRVVLGILTKEQALQQMAVRCVGQIQERIADGIAPPNALSTEIRKRSSTPLIDSGQLRASISSRVDSG